MKVTQEKLPASQVSLEVEIPPETIQKEYDRVVKELTRSVNLPGFRKGKVPRKILIQRMGAQRINATTLENLIKNNLGQALEKEDIKAIGDFQLVSKFEDLLKQFDPKTPLTVSAKVDVWPDVTLKQCTDWQLQIEKVEYKPERLDSFLEERRHQIATLVPVEGRASQMGDVATVDFSGRFPPEGDGESESDAEPQLIPDAQGTDFQLELSEGKFIPGFIEGIVGLNIGESKEISLAFPENYPKEDLAGQPAIFSITLKELKEKELPELDDEFAQDISDVETLAELRENLEKRFQADAEFDTNSNKRKALLNRLVEQVEVELPMTLIDEEVNRLLNQTATQLSRQGVDIKQVFTQDNMPRLRQDAIPEALRSLHEQLAIQELSKRESIEADPDAIAARVQELQEQLAGEDIDPDRLQAVVEAEKQKQAVLDWLEEHSTIEWLPEGSLAAADEAADDTEDSAETEPEVEADEAVEVTATEVTETTDSEDPG